MFVYLECLLELQHISHGGVQANVQHHPVTLLNHSNPIQGHIKTASAMEGKKPHGLSKFIRQLLASKTLHRTIPRML